MGPALQVIACRLRCATVKASEGQCEQLVLLGGLRACASVQPGTPHTSPAMGGRGWAPAVPGHQLASPCEACCDGGLSPPKSFRVYSSLFCPCACISEMLGRSDGSGYRLYKLLRAVSMQDYYCSRFWLPLAHELHHHSGGVSRPHSSPGFLEGAWVGVRPPAI